MNNILITSIVTALLLSGCGSSSSQTPGADINNSGKAKNALGYYGEGVYFAGMPVVGFWDDLVAGYEYYHIFKLNEDGSVELYDRNATQVHYLGTNIYEYGVNESGNKLKLYYGSTGNYYGHASVTIEYLDANITHADHCINARYTSTSMSNGTTQLFEPYIICRSDELNVTYMEQFWWHNE